MTHGQVILAFFALMLLPRSGRVLYTIDRVKHMIWDQQGIHQDQQQLIFDGNELEDFM